MGRRTPRGLAQHIRDLAGFLRADSRPDGELLAAFTVDGDAAAFTTLVARHGPAVWAACRRELSNDADTEDAFQATFIALARQAGQVRPASLPGWLAAVAQKVAVESRKAARRRDATHRRLHARVAAADPPPDADTQAAVREELAGLPERLRVTLTLYYLDGKTQAEVGRILGVTDRAVAHRLRVGLSDLRGRLARRGMAVTSAALAALLGRAPAAAAVSADLVTATAEAALLTTTGGVPKTAAARLALEVARAAARARLRAYGLFLAVAIGTAGGAVCLQPGRASVPPVRGQPAVAPVDRFGDPLPADALARIGTNRLRPATFPGDPSVAIAPDAKTIYSVDGRDVVRVWDVATGKEVGAIPGPRNCLGVAVSADGRRLAASGMFEAWAWDLGGTGPARRWATAPGGCGFWSVAFSPDGRTVACGGDGGAAVHVLSAATGERQKSFAGSGHKVLFSHDGRTLAAWWRFDGTLTLWDVASGEKRLTLAGDAGRNAPVTSFAFSPDDRAVAACSDRSLRVWDLATGAARRLADDAAAGTFVAFEPAGRVLVEAGGGRVRFWDAGTGKECRPAVSAPDLSPNTMWDACRLSADGRLLVTASTTAIQAWDVRTGRPVGPTGVPPGHVFSVSFSADGTGLALVACGNDHVLPQLYDARTGQLRCEIRIDAGDGHSLLVGPGAAAAGGGLAAPAVKNAPAPNSVIGLCVSRASAAAPPVVAPVTADAAGGTHFPVLSPGGRFVAFSQADRVTLTERATSKQLHAFNTKDPVAQMAFAPGGGALACGTFNGTGAAVSVWDTRTGLRQGGWEVDLQGGAFPPLAVTSDGTRVAAGSDDAAAGGRLRVWDVATGAVLWELAQPTNPALSVAFSPDGRSLAGGGTDGTVRVWESYSGLERLRRPGHRGQVMAVAFSPDGGRLASGGVDTTALIWHTRPAPAPSAADAEARWAALTGRDGEAAYRAVLDLAADPAAAVPFLRARLAAAGPAPGQVARWVADLAHPRFEVREAATRELVRAGDLVEPALRAAARAETSPEAAARLRTILRRQGPQSAYKLGVVRGVEVLERLAGDAAARTLLAELAATPAGNFLGQEARAACRRLESAAAARTP